MADIMQIIQKIQSWLIEEGWNYKGVPDPNALFNIVVYPNEFQNVNVAVLRTHPQKILIKTSISFNEDDSKAFLILTEHEKKEFQMNLEILLIQVNLIYNILPDPPRRIDSVEMTRQIYFDGLTRDKFIDSIIAILRGLQIVKLNYNSLQPETSKQ